MRKPAFISSRRCSLAVAVLLAAANSGWPASGREPAKAEAEPPKSVFQLDVSAGKDPFFPTSTRRLAPETRPVQNGSDPLPAETEPPKVEQIQLRGIVGAPGNRLALINNQDFAPGEERMVRVSNGHARVRCVSISADSVTVLIGDDPEPKVLRMAEER